MKKIDKDYYAEREEKQLKIRQIKSRMGGHPNWWHGCTGSPVTTEVTQKVTQVVPGHLGQHDAEKEMRAEAQNDALPSKEFHLNCMVAKSLREHQADDTQM